ncbi:hypothetical protein M0R01_04610 [bacterium]|jgi:hypothetical protein|nr:hypothetical protein [bacterium]
MEESKYETSTLYKGKVQIRFYPISHQYWISIDGSPFKRKSGVTTFIGIKDKSKALQIWQQQITADFLLNALDKKQKIDSDKAIEAIIQCDIARDTAADIGKEIHAWCEAYIRNKLKQPGFENVPEIPNFPEAVTGVNSFLEWEKEHKVKFISTERVVYSKEHDYMGTMDFEAEIDGILCMGDFKSSNGLYNGVRMQTAAYAYADMEENTKKKYKGRWAIRLSKYSESEYLKREERKKEIKRAIAKFQNKECKEYPIKPYQVFEAKFLDNGKDFIKRDMDAFLNVKALFAWDKDTDPFYQKENW